MEIRDAWFFHLLIKVIFTKIEIEFKYGIYAH